VANETYYAFQQEIAALSMANYALAAPAVWHPGTAIQNSKVGAWREANTGVDSITEL
jgi:hypothetical protein